MIIVISGGSIQGVYLLGAIQYILDQGIRPTHYVVNSIGGIIASLLCMRFEIHQILKIFKSSTVMNTVNKNKIDIDCLINKYGLCDTDDFFEIIKDVIIAKHGYVPTLKELYTHSHIDLTIVGSNITLMKPIYFNHKSHPEIDILSLLRITTSIPLLFQSVEYNGHLYCDGGLFDNFPIIYANNLLTRDTIIGIRLNPSIKFVKITNILDYIHTIMKIVAHRILYETTDNYKNIIINIDTSMSYYDTINIIMKTHSIKEHIQVCEQMFREGYTQCNKIYLSNRIAKNRIYKYKND